MKILKFIWRVIRALLIITAALTVFLLNGVLLFFAWMIPPISPAVGLLVAVEFAIPASAPKIDIF